jgi:predicted RNase H-like HicB family nuclease
MEVRDMPDISFDVQIYKEGDIFVAHALKLNVSSCGYSDEEARTNGREAVKLFLEAAEHLGTLREALEESGYRLEAGE